MSDPWRLLVFGATGAVGTAVCAAGRERGWQVIGARRPTSATVATAADADEWLAYDPVEDPTGTALAGQAPFDAVCWAHGTNASDSFDTFDVDRHLQIYRANCLSVVLSIAALQSRDLLSSNGARLVVVSSIWQERARPDKLSYTMTKATVGGIVRAASVDLGRHGHLVNGVLPGVLDTPMTRANLSADQIDAVSGRVPAERLPDVATVAQTISFLCSADNRSVNGQSITVDGGMSNAVLL